MPNKTWEERDRRRGSHRRLWWKRKGRKSVLGEAATVPGDLDLAWFVHDVHINTRKVIPFPNHFLHATSAIILFNASCTHPESNRFSSDPLTPTHLTPMLCSQSVRFGCQTLLRSSRTVIFCTSTVTSVSCKYTRWVINADVGYDMYVAFVPWTELSVRTIALAGGQHTEPNLPINSKSHLTKSTAV